jgi:hypothetical protein
MLYGGVVLETIMNRLKAEGCQGRTGPAGEELYFAPAGTAPEPARTTLQGPAGEHQDAAGQDHGRPTVVESPVEPSAAGAARAGGSASLPQDRAQPAVNHAAIDGGGLVPAPGDGARGHEAHDNAQGATAGEEPPRPGGESSPRPSGPAAPEQVPPAQLPQPVSDRAAGERFTDDADISMAGVERAAALTQEAASPGGSKLPPGGENQGGRATQRPSPTSQQGYERRATMPKKFMNTLAVEGAAPEVNRFVKRARGRHAAYLPTDRAADGPSASRPAVAPREVLLSLNALYPVPPEVLAAGAEAGERWQLEHWGCPADNAAGQVTVRRLGPHRVEYAFATLAGPPLGWLERVAEDFPALDFDLYFLAAWEAHGRRSYTRGELAQDWEEQPTAEDQARAGLLDGDYCPACGDPLGADGRRCAHCEPQKATDAVETTADAARAGQSAAALQEPAADPSDS